MRRKVPVKGYESPKTKRRAKPARRHWVRGHYRSAPKGRRRGR